MNTNEIIRLLESQVDEITATIVYDLITDKGATDDLYKKLYSEYKGAVPILDRLKPESIPDYKALNKIPSGLRGVFVLQGATYTLGKTSKVSSPDDKTLEKVLEFRKKNLLHASDIALLTMGCVCGQSGRLLFFDKQANLRVKNFKSWEYLVVKDATTNLSQYGLHYYEVTEKIGKKEKKYIHAELYDSTKIQYYMLEGGTAKKNPAKPDQKHGFEYVPIVEYVNDKTQGDFQEERPQIDAYDLLLSIEQDELEDLRTSYMVFSGAKPTPEQMEEAKFTGAFGSDDPEFKVAYLEKVANAERTKSQLERLRKDAFTSANRVDMRDDKSTAKSGYARILELQTLEDDCSLKRIEMQKVSTNMYEILASGFKKTGDSIEWETIVTEYMNNLPIDLTYYADFTQKMFGKIPTRILYEQLPFIHNVDTAVAEFEKEAKGVLDYTGNAGAGETN